MSEILQTKLEAHIQTSDHRALEVAAALKEINDALKNKISYKEFWSVIGIEVLILIAMFGWIAYEMGNLQLTADTTGQKVSMIQGKLDPYNVQFKN